MDGPQDVGGRDGFGPVAPEADEPLFHAPWEARALGLTLASGALGHWNLDESRHARENRHPLNYYRLSYYALWIEALQTLLVRHGELTPAEIDSGRTMRPGKRPERCLRADCVAEVLRRGSPTARTAPTPPRFVAGDRVVTRRTPSRGHTRLPAYARGKPGVVVAHVGAHVLPDEHAHGRGESPEHLYTVAFDAACLWGDAGESDVTVSIDAWESYLDVAD